jgi:hypothetical protein
LLAALFALLVPAKADAAGGSYTFSGGSESARATVRNALEASAFDWSLVPEPVTIEIVDCGCAGARPGVIVLDERLLESWPYGRAYTWGVVQHEYAHQVWWLALDDAQRSFLQGKLGAPDLCYEQSVIPHDAHACERFASTFAWAYWPNAGNPMRTDSAMGGRLFRALMVSFLGTVAPVASERLARIRALRLS